MDADIANILLTREQIQARVKSLAAEIAAVYNGVARGLIGDVVKHRPALRPLLAGLSCIALIACLVLTRSQLAYWKNSKTLFTHTLAVTRQNCDRSPCSRYSISSSIRNGLRISTPRM